MATLAQTITVIKGKKVVSNSKQLINVFKEAKAAYREKKSELKSERETRDDGNYARAIEDSRNRARNGQGKGSSKASPDRGNLQLDSSRRDASARDRTAPFERGYSDSFYVNDGDAQFYRQPQAAWSTQNFARTNLDRGELSRTYSATDLQEMRQPQYSSAVSDNRNFEGYLTDSELPPPLPARHFGEEHELRMKIFSLNNLLNEANCMQHSARAIIKHLETNPEAMAAVALSLAEISNLLTKMAPGVLFSFKTGAPAVVALLLSSEFLIAAGVGVGLTVVALGSYKIIKRIKAKKASEKEPEADELEDVTADLDAIMTWRRGVADSDLESVGTSVEGEFITPMASQHFQDLGVLSGRDHAVPSSTIRRIEGTPRDLLSNFGQSMQGQGKSKQLSGLRNIFKKRQEDT